MRAPGHWSAAWPHLGVLAEWPVRSIELPEGRGTVWEAPGGEVLGGVPGVRDNPDLDVLGWEPPVWLARLYRVHGGLGPCWRDAGVRWTEHAILPWDEVTPLTRHIRFGEENITYDPADIVRFAPDGRGGGLVFEGRERARIRWFDAARHTLSAPWSLDRALAWVVRGWIGSAP